MCVGKPPKFTSVKQLEKKMDEYFLDCDKRGKRSNVVGLNLFCGFGSRFGLYQMARDKSEYHNAISRATMRIEADRVSDLVSPGNGNVNGMKFDLTNNFGWVDERKQDINLGGQANNPLEFKVTFVKPE
jgi:hypothetical protein